MSDENEISIGYYLYVIISPFLCLSLALSQSFLCRLC